MLHIIVTPERLYFKDLNEDLFLKISSMFELTESKKGYYIEDKAEKLYKILIKLAFDYDIEII